MLTTPAFAQSAGGIAEGGFGLLPIIFVMVIFYFLLIRPQQKRAKQHKEMLAAIRRGDKIVTSGGLMGTVVKVIDDNDTVEVEIAKDESLAMAGNSALASSMVPNVIMASPLAPWSAG